MNRESEKTARRLMLSDALQNALQKDDSGTMKGKKTGTGKRLLNFSLNRLEGALNEVVCLQIGRNNPTSEVRESRMMNLSRYKQIDLSTLEKKVFTTTANAISDTKHSKLTEHKNNSFFGIWSL